MIFLYSNGVGASKSVRIYKTYGDKTIELIQENPYRLAQDIYGIGFVTADTITQKMGVEKTSLIHAKAGLRHALFEEVDNVNCAYPKAVLLPKAVELLKIPLDILEQTVTEEIKSIGIVLDTIGEEECLFLPNLYYYEKKIAERIASHSQGSPVWGELNTNAAIP